MNDTLFTLGIKAAEYDSNKLYSALQTAETGGQKNPWIRTKIRTAPGGSTAYGPVQISGTLARDYSDRFSDLFNPDEQNYLRRFNHQAKMFAHHGNMKGKLEEFNPRYDYGGTGHLNRPSDQKMYQSVANKIIQHMYSRSKDIGDFLKRWRGKVDPTYVTKIKEALGKL